MMREWINLCETEIVTEINRPESRAEVDTLLKNAGYTRLGKGLFGAVYQKPGQKYVLKVFSSKDNAYLDFIKVAKANQNNPHFPRFFGKLIRVNPNYYAIRTELLTPFNPHKVGDYAYALEDYIQSGTDDGELKAFPELKAACDIVRKELLSKYWFDAKDESFMMRGNTIVIVDAALDPDASENMRWNPEPKLDAPKPKNDISDDDLLRDLEL